MHKSTVFFLMALPTSVSLGIPIASAEVVVTEEFSAPWACATDQRQVISPHSERSRALTDCSDLVEADGVQRRVIKPDLIIVKVSQQDPPDEPLPPPPPDEEPPDEPPPPPPPVESSAYRGIPDPAVLLGYDPYGGYEADNTLTGYQGDAHLSGVGSASNPYVIDISGATFRRIGVSGSYVILEGGNTATVNAPSMSGPFIHVATCDRCTVRNVRLSGPKTDQSHSAAVNMGSNNVWLGGAIHGFGDNRQDAREQDFHGIKVFGPDVWILDAEIYDVSGDSVQVGDSSRGTGNRVYIGGGYFHHNRENAIDIKDSEDVVVSGVRMEGFRPTSSDPGSAIVIHDDAYNARILDSVITDSTMGIVSSGASGHLIESNDITALKVGIQLRNTSDITVRDNSIAAPTCVQRQSGVSGTVQTGCQ